MSADHRYVAYGDDSDLRVAAAEFLSEGPTLGARVGYFGWGGLDELRDRLGGLAGVDALLGGSAQITSLDQHFRADEVPDPVALRAFWAHATDAALDAGFSALRVVADTTPWVGAGRERAVFLRGEHLVDRYGLDHPFALLCACDASALTDDALAEIACVHPSARGLSPPFHLHACPGADLALGGEVDAFCVPLMERVLAAVAEGEAGRDVVIDAARLGFLDHQGLLALDAHGERAGLRAVVLRHAPPMARIVVELLNLRHVRVEAAR